MAWSSTYNRSKNQNKQLLNWLQGNGTSGWYNPYGNVANGLQLGGDILKLTPAGPLGWGLETAGSIMNGVGDGVQGGDFWTGLGSATSDWVADLVLPVIAPAARWITNAQTQRDMNYIMNNVDRSNFSDFTNDELEALLDYYTDEKGWWFTKRQDIDEQSFINDYNDYLNWREKVGDRPEDIDFDTLYNNVNAAIDTENAQIMNIYDQGLARTQGLLNRELQENQAAYADYRNQILTNEAMSQQQIAGSTRFELERQQRNAITRGASAAQRLVSNVNAQLGLQAQSAQQALNTSNALAQQLINHRQAQAGIRSSYNNALTAYDNQRAGILAGQFERKQNARNTASMEAKTRYQDAMDQWERRLSAYGGSSPYVDFYRNSQYRKDTGKSTYGY